MSRNLLNVVVMAIGISLGNNSAAQSPCGIEDHTSKVCSKMKAETSPDKGTRSDIPAAGCKSRHSVALSWKASVSLSSSHVDGQGYNLYRLNPDGSCMKIKEQLEQPVYVDCSVEPGQTYRYVATALKQKCESEPSNVVEVLVPQP